VKLVSLIAAGDGAEACVCDLQDHVALSQPTVSHHLKQLVDADLLILEKEGRCALYMINKEGMSEFVKYLNRYEE